MDLVFERGDRSRPVGHALVYFRADDGSIMATYVTVPPIKFDLAGFMPGVFAQMLQGMDLSVGNEVMAAPVPPLPEPIAGLDYLHLLAERRQDDLIYAGGIVRGDPMRLMAETQEAARSYGELYGASIDVEPPAPASPNIAAPDDSDGFALMSEQERLNELTRLTGRARDELQAGGASPELEHDMEQLAKHLPAKYRPDDAVRAALTPGDKGQRLAQLYLERSYKLFNEEYLDLERLDREIEDLAG